MEKKTIKDRCYIILKEDFNGRASEKQLAQRYTERYPDYDKNHTKTKTPSFEKLCGSINAELSRNKLHKNIKVDKSATPEEYFIVPDYLSMPVIIQPIGNRYTKEEFLKDNYNRWAESILYEKEWKKSVGAIVLFVKSGNVFAKGLITNIEKNKKQPKYQLNYFYNLKEVDQIDYDKIYEYSEYSRSEYFREYLFINDYRSVKILEYIYSLESKKYFDDQQLDNLLENDFENITPLAPERKPQKPPDKEECNGTRKYPRNASYAKQSLVNANYKCEINSEHNTFISNATNEQYMEAHHLFPLSAQDRIYNSLDVPANIISLCPGCHRKIHHAKIEDKEQMLISLFEKRESELKVFGITETIKDLIEIYKNYKV
ncbi:hypothetical protein CRV02_13040 [Arcobacter sp. CECT 8989]|uniref:HNH endonuclease n=1 Tax=Arcobacter sp. CECT 8989 TaxID=2044509 RepID=UPI00100A2C36|nr:HNH endonuclease signature motif containing protein [Arcobacter sp. CECT 8989]RXJ98671.1 hypothetical protein CRV02_13040 [Arcobacter sp. CECT 8989]